MSVISFIQDLGIIPNKTTGLEDDPNLLQGQEFMEYERMYNSKVEPQLKNLESTGITGVKSVTETFENKEIKPSVKKNIDYNTIVGKKEDSDLLAKSRRTQYFMWMLVTIIITVVGLQTIVSGKINNGIIVIISLLLIIFIFKRVI